jgi:alpha-tubulin suppressor-like RCC1 family protein
MLKKRFICAALAVSLLCALGFAAAAEEGDAAEVTSAFGAYRQTVAAGFRHSVAVSADGSVLVWGDNSQNQLGQAKQEAGQDKLSGTPVQLPNMSRVISVAAGD